MFNFKNVMIVAMVVMMSFSFFGCNIDMSADQKQAQATEKLMTEVNNQIGMPNIVNFQQKKLMKEIFEITDKENLVTYAYLKADYTGKLIYLGKCIGYGIPFSAQYTNPQRVSKFFKYFTLPQADPNGLFMPTSSSATWLLMVDPETKKPRPVYIEPEIVVSPFKLTGSNIIY